jgi:hypothetical protein
MYSPSFVPAESWRASLGFTQRIRNFYFTVDGSYSINLNQPGLVDLNFAGTPQFNLANEGGRPVYVSASSIDPGTGSVSPVQSRVSPQFGPGVESVSDLRSYVKQVTFYAIPNIPFKVGQLTVAYTYFDGQSRGRGFDQSTGGDPRAIESASNVSHHQFVVQLAHLFKKVVVTAFVRAQSGYPFTPLVAGDINGDGSSNDRAFVFNPATVSDPALASGMRTLLASAPSTARSCLQSQMGTIAARGSCTGPWSATMNAYVYFIEALPGTDKRAHVTLNFNNVLGGLDALVHGSSHLQGWGAPGYPDQTLYRVAGFDASAQQFTYAVNPRFGSASPAFTSLRNPFRVTLGVTVDIGHSYDEQNLDLNLRIRPALAGTRAPADSIKARYYRCCSWTDIYRIITQMSDSLALTRAQVDAMAAERGVLIGKEDSVFSVLGKYLADVPLSYDRKEVLKHVSDAQDAAFQIVLDEKPFLLKTLTNGQIRLLPSILYQFLTGPKTKGRWFMGGPG